MWELVFAHRVILCVCDMYWQWLLVCSLCCVNCTACPWGHVQEWCSVRLYQRAWALLQGFGRQLREFAVRHRKHAHSKKLTWEC
ncbi:hypothetical protein COO60DRAFT_1569877 [Scenedesmus sp. NREL 46B-D3]|nr:hypothetical protein COO60DRAFT_1569877 [Scenedesmus sp. NREL 46B-D3]